LILAFPDGREFGKEFRIFRPSLAFPDVNSCCDFNASRANSLSSRGRELASPGQGIFFVSAGINPSGQGIRHLGEFAPKN
jgi:hypothetical protein